MASPVESAAGTTGKARAWYALVTEKVSQTEVTRRADLARRLERARKWGVEVRALISSSDKGLEEGRAREMATIAALNSNLARDQEMADLRLEAIAGMFEYASTAALAHAPPAFVVVWRSASSPSASDRWHRSVQITCTHTAWLTTGNRSRLLAGN